MDQPAILLIGALATMVSGCAPRAIVPRAERSASQPSPTVTSTPETVPQMPWPADDRGMRAKMTALAAARAAERRRPFDPSLQGRQFYLCCNLRFNRDNDATDANYAYPDSGTTLPLGTRVRIVEVGRWHVRFQTERDVAPYYLELRFGREATTAAKYFHEILRETDPTVALVTMPPALADAIDRGQPVAGMTKDQVLMAHGYPPLHQTASTDANEWIYYYTGALVDHVLFDAGRMVSMFRGPAPE